jgi:hypothetical protein
VIFRGSFGAKGSGALLRPAPPPPTHGSSLLTTAGFQEAGLRGGGRGVAGGGGIPECPALIYSRARSLRIKGAISLSPYLLSFTPSRGPHTSTSPSPSPSPPPPPLDHQRHGNEDADETRAGARQGTPSSAPSGGSAGGGQSVRWKRSSAGRGGGARPSRPDRKISRVWSRHGAPAMSNYGLR